MGNAQQNRGASPRIMNRARRARQRSLAPMPSHRRSIHWPAESMMGDKLCRRRSKPRAGFSLGLRQDAIVLAAAFLPLQAILRILEDGLCKTAPIECFGVLPHPQTPRFVQDA